MDTNAAFGALRNALYYNKVPGYRGRRQADAGEFMLMSESRTEWAFKHRGSRNYLYIKKRNGGMSYHDGDVFDDPSNRGRTAATVALPVGKRVETRHLRIHRYMDSLRIWDLTYAGKRGKRVDILALTDLDRLKHDTFSNERFERWLQEVIKKNLKFDQAQKSLDALLDSFELVNLSPMPKKYIRQERGVDIDPPASVTPHLDMTLVDIPEATLTLKAKPTDIHVHEVKFHVNEQGRRDFYTYETYLYNTRKKRETKKLYQWMVQNQKALQKVQSMSDLKQMLMRDNIPYSTH